MREPIFCHEGSAALLALPHDGLRVTYTLDYPHPALRSQTVSFEVDEGVYARQIAPARTFCTEEEARSLRQKGFGKGADRRNTLVMGPSGPRGNRLRFADECARHKVLDLLGDLGLLNLDLRGHFIGIRSGHALNHRLCELILKDRRAR